MEKDKTRDPVADLKKLLCEHPGWEDMLKTSVEYALQQIDSKKPRNLPELVEPPKGFEGCCGYYDYLEKVSKWTPPGGSR